MQLIRRVCVRPIDLCVKKRRINEDDHNTMYATMLLSLNWYGTVTHF